MGGERGIGCRKLIVSLNNARTNCGEILKIACTKGAAVTKECQNQKGRAGVVYKS